jgi:hypothetical protein
VCHAAGRCAGVDYSLRSTPTTGTDFEIQPISSTTPPLIFTMLIIVTTVQVTKIRAVPDTTILG